MARTRNITKPDSNARNAEFLGWAATLVEMNKGKKKMKDTGRVNISQDVFLKMMRSGN